MLISSVEGFTQFNGWFSPPLNLPINTLNDIYVFDTDSSLAVGDNGVIIKTIDGGITWTPLESGTTTSLHAVHFINSIIDDFNSLPEDLFYLHERAFLLEKKLKFSDSGPSIGDFILEQTEYRRLEDKILFLIAKFRKTKSNLKGDTLWQNFMELKEIRNNIMHPRKGIEIDINIDNSKRYQDISKDVISFVSKHVYGKKIEF